MLLCPRRQLRVLYMWDALTLVELLDWVGAGSVIVRVMRALAESAKWLGIRRCPLHCGLIVLEHSDITPYREARCRYPPT